MFYSRRGVYLTLSSRATYNDLTGGGVWCPARGTLPAQLSIGASVQVIEWVLYTLEREQSCRLLCACPAVCILSQLVNGFGNFTVIGVCGAASCGDLDEKAMIFNMSNECSSVLDNMLAWLHREYFCPLNHHFICLRACILAILSSPSVSKKKKKRMLSTHNQRGFCQILCLLYKLCLTEQSFFIMAVDCGTTSAGFKG